MTMLKVDVMEQSSKFDHRLLQHIKNKADTNKFEGWPEVLEMEGCIPRRED